MFSALSFNSGADRNLLSSSLNSLDVLDELSHQKKLFRMLFKWLAIVPASYTLWWCFYSDVSFLMYKWPNILTGCMDYFFNQPWLTFIYVLLHLPLLSSKISYAIRYQLLLCQVRTFLPLQFLFRYIINDGLLEF